MEREQSIETLIIIIEELHKHEPDYNHIRQLLDTNITVLNEPIDIQENYVLHHLCRNNTCPVDLIQYCIEQQQEQQGANDTPMTLAIEQPNIDGKLPLHIACKNNHSEQVIKLLVTNYPSAIKKPCTVTGIYPLHYVCQNTSYVSVIELVLTMYPEALTKQCRGLQYNPLHWLCVNENISSSELLSYTEQLRNEFPNIMSESAQQQQSGGCTPLHMLCKNTQSSFEMIQLIHDLYSDAIKIPDTNGYLPLHIACEYTRKVNVIDYLIHKYCVQRKYFRDVWYKSNDGWLPIHMACAYHNELSVIERLVGEFPSSAVSAFVPFKGMESSIVTTPLDLAMENGSFDEYIIYLPQHKEMIMKKCNNQFGIEYPFHEACQDQDLESIQLLLQQHPHTIQQKCINGNYPLHYACEYSPYETVIQFLLSEYPLALQEQCTFGGDTPLHNLCMKKGLCLEIVSNSLSVHDAFGKALLKQNDLGQTPLHIACQYNLSKGWIEYLVQHGIKATQLPDFFGRLPLHIACENSNDSYDDVIEMLIKKYPPGTRKVSDDGLLPLHIACTSGQSSLHVVQLLVTEYPWALVVPLTMDLGNNPLQIAIEANVSDDILKILEKETISMKFTLYQQIVRILILSEL